MFVGKLFFVALSGALGEYTSLDIGSCPMKSPMVTLGSTSDKDAMVPSLRCPVGRESPENIQSRIFFLK